METTVTTVTGTPRPALRHDAARIFARRMGLPEVGRIRLERALRWVLVATSVALLLLGINP